MELYVELITFKHFKCIKNKLSSGKTPQFMCFPSKSKVLSEKWLPICSLMPKYKYKFSMPILCNQNICVVYLVSRR